jgi:cell division protein FtsI (penicillin-binding protein 3)
MASNIFRRKKPPEAGPQRGRMTLISVLVALAFVAIMIRAWYVQIHDNEKYISDSKRQHETTIKVSARRGDIFDTNGRELALTALVPSIYAIPRIISKPGVLAHKVAGILNLDPTQLEKRLSNGRAFTWLKRHVSAGQAAAIKSLKHKGLGLRDEPRRFYPNGGLMGAILGFAGIDGKGLEGLERDWNSRLKGRQHILEAVADAKGRRALRGGALPLERLSGKSLQLTIDARIQEVLERTLFEQVAEMSAAGAVAVVMDPRNGDILAIAQTPIFDPNNFRLSKPTDWRNRAITDLFEPGSTIKPFLLAAAIDAGRIRTDMVWDGYHGRIRVGRKTITDVHGSKTLTNHQIIQKSSNVGAVQVGQRLGKEMWHRYLRSFGFGASTNVGMRGEQAGSLRHHKKWGQIHLATFSYGYGFSTTAMQMVRAASAIANGGMLMKPRLVKAVTDANGRVLERFPPRMIRRVLSKKAADYARDGMIMVTQKGGTGRRARVPGYVVAGKTGTAHKVDPLIRGYSKDKVIASFVGFAPAEAPRIAIYIAVDEPTKAHYGGLVAAPIFARVAQRALPYLGVKATESVSSSLVELESPEAATAAEGLDPQSRPWWQEQSVVAGSSNHVVVPDLKGKSLAQVIQTVEALDLKVRIDGSGVVMTQSPQTGALISPKTILTIALGLPGDVRVGRAQ